MDEFTVSASMATCEVAKGSKKAPRVFFSLSAKKGESFNKYIEMMLIVFRDPFFHKTHTSPVLQILCLHNVACGLICHTYVFIVVPISEERLKLDQLTEAKMFDL